MTLRNVKPWIELAQRQGFAVGAFNANTLEQVQAVVLAAEAEQAPVIVQISHRALVYIGSGNAILGLRYMAEIGKTAAQSVSVPVALHLDHANESEVTQALALGFTSVMFDGSELPFDENVAATVRLREMAHGLGAFIEAELGEVPRVDASGAVDHESVLTDPDEAARFADATGIDALAIAIGSVHSVKSKTVDLDLERLKAIRAKVQTPLVLHGSSGVLDAAIAAGIKGGLCKVNVATQMNGSFTKAIRAYLADDLSGVDPRLYFTPAREAMVEAVRERLRFFGAAGKASAFV
jgi:fructose-bisphosphate aldolase class II